MELIYFSVGLPQHFLQALRNVIKVPEANICPNLQSHIYPDDKDKKYLAASWLLLLDLFARLYSLWNSSLWMLSLE